MSLDRVRWGERVRERLEDPSRAGRYVASTPGAQEYMRQFGGDDDEQFASDSGEEDLGDGAEYPDEDGD